MTNHYELLGISPDSTKSEIRHAYHKLALQYHPDKYFGPDKLFKKINDAYSVLMNDQTRDEYDKNLERFEHNLIMLEKWKMIIEAVSIKYNISDTTSNELNKLFDPSKYELGDAQLGKKMYENITNYIINKSVSHIVKMMFN